LAGLLKEVKACYPDVVRCRNTVWPKISEQLNFMFLDLEEEEEYDKSPCKSQQKSPNCPNAQ